MDSTNTLQPTEIVRENILGVNVSAVNLDQAAAMIDYWITNNIQQYVCVTPAHGIMECQADPELLHIFNTAGMVTPDGMSVVWILKLKGHREVSRVYGPDLLNAVCDYYKGKSVSHFFYGGEPGVADELVNALTAQYKDLKIAGTYSPPFRALTPQEDQEVIERINNSQASIVWVGISTPKQERWMFDHLHKLNAPVMIGVGAAYDFLSGRKKQAPRWMQKTGLEWLFRLGSEPKRLWRRYIQYPYFVILVLAQLLGIKK